MKRHIKAGIHTEKGKRLVSYMGQRIEGFQNIPAVLMDRACKISVLSFLALLLWGGRVGIGMRSGRDCEGIRGQGEPWHGPNPCRPLSCRELWISHLCR